MIFRQARRQRYTVISNGALRDERLSFKAVGLLAYLLSMPDVWNTNYRQLATTHRDGEHAVREALKELEVTGYLRRRRVRIPESGKFAWEIDIYESPVDKDVDG